MGARENLSEELSVVTSEEVGCDVYEEKKGMSWGERWTLFYNVLDWLVRFTD